MGRDPILKYKETWWGNRLVLVSAYMEFAKQDKSMVSKGGSKRPSQSGDMKGSYRQKDRKTKDR